MSVPLKITVVKQLKSGDIGEKLAPSVTQECQILKVGQEFTIPADAPMKMPEGFCTWAWADIHRDIIHLRLDGEFPWMKEGTMLSCCTDGVRPVVFKIEKIKP